MLDYEWGNPSTIILTGEENNPDSDQSRQILDHYTQPFNENLVHSNGFLLPQHQHQTFHHTQIQNPTQTQTHFHSLYDPRVYGSPYQPAPAPAPHPQQQQQPQPMLSLESISQTAAGPTGFMMVPKSEPIGLDFTSRIGLNLGGRTYFSSEEDDFVSRLYRRSRGIDPGSINSPRCQAEGCNADLTHAKHYHRRHKVCEFHSKAATVVAAGMTQRFCQQCSRFHLLSEFDNGKRSCRKRLADHNRRRRKNQNPPSDNNKHPPLENARTPQSSEILGRSPTESTVQASSSVTVAISPPRMSLDCFRRRTTTTTSFQGATSSSASTGSLFFSNG